MARWLSGTAASKASLSSKLLIDLNVEGTGGERKGLFRICSTLWVCRGKSFQYKGFMDLDTRYPGLSDLQAHARRRIPHFVWEYLESATGDESAHRRNAEALDEVVLKTGILGGKQTVDLSTELLGRTYTAPIGIAPVGMSGLMWPGAERILADLAVREGIPYGLSTVAAMTPEDLAVHVGDRGWFQLYPPADPEIRADLLNRAREAGFHTLVLTVDVAVASRRERQTRARLTQPMKITPRLVAQAALRPEWSLQVLRSGVPTLATLEKYADVSTARSGTAHVGYLLRTAPDWEYVKALRDLWDGPLVVKGVLGAEPVARLIDEGVDAIWVSNHGGRQFSAAPAALDVLPSIRAAAGADYPLICDGAVRCGTDVLRMIAKGADFVMLGRAWHWGVAARGAEGAAHVLRILKAGMVADMGQMAIERPVEARARLP